MLAMQRFQDLLPGFLNGPWVQANGGLTSGSDVAAWPYRVSLLCVSSPTFWVHCIGWLTLGARGIMGFLFGGFFWTVGWVTRPHERAHRTIEAVLATEYVAEKLDINIGDPLIMLESTAYLANGTPIEYFQGYHSSRRTRFSVDLIRYHD